MNIIFFAICLIFSYSIFGKTPTPTVENLRYGTSPQSLMDFWKAKSQPPTPLVIFIHGGAFVHGDKDMIRKQDGIIKEYLTQGVSIASINYSFLKTKPIQRIMEEMASMVQFVRHFSQKLNIRKDQVLVYGFSAGGGASTWLATHDDRKNPASLKLREHESSKPNYAFSIKGQFSYDIEHWNDPEIFGMPFDYYGFLPIPRWKFYRAPLRRPHHPKTQKARKQVDMLDNIDPSDVPMTFISLRPQDYHWPPANLEQLYHHPKHLKVLYQKFQEQGVESNYWTSQSDLEAHQIVQRKVFELFL